MKTNSAVLLLLLGSTSTNEAQALQLQNLEQEQFVLDDKEAADLDQNKIDQDKHDKRQKELVTLMQKESETPIKPFEEEKAEQKLAASKPRSSMATVPLRNIQNQQYVGDVYIGNPPQKMTVQFDTGSAIVYVLTDKCNEHCNELPKFKTGKKGKTGADYLDPSALSDDLMNRVEYGYGSGYINGFAQETQICFAEDSKAAPCVKGVNILQADQATGVDQDRFAGIIGLGPRSSESRLRAFILQLQQINEFAKEDQLDPKFSVYLSKDPSQNGDITFGGYDVKQYAKAGAQDSDIFWGLINPSEKYWTLTMNDIGFAEKINGFTSISGATAKNVIIDTGVSYAIIPTKDFMAIEEGLKKYGVECKEPKNSSLTSTYTCKCDKYENLPDITINVKESPKEDAKTKRFTLPKESYMELKDGGCDTMRLTPSSETWGLSSQGYWVMGDIFLQNYYSIYDFPNHRMGLIESKDFGVVSDGWNKHADPQGEAKVQIDWGQEFEVLSK